MFTSYGYLGTNYNLRVARTDKTFSTILSNKDPHKQLLDQKNRPVGATYSDQVKEGGSLDELWGYKMSGHSGLVTVSNMSAAVTTVYFKTMTVNGILFSTAVR